MTRERGAPTLLSLATLQRSISLLARPVNRILAISVALVYAFISMLTGGMLTIFSPPAQLSPFALVIWSGTPWWYYPGVLVATPSFILSLPFLPTVLMVLVSIGVGIGMSVAFILAARLIKMRRAGAGTAAAAGSVAGLTPAMIALVTLGACCSTTAAATAGVAAVAQASGTTVDTLLANSWYLGLFQLGVLWVGLFAQEQLIVVYGVLFGLAEVASTAPHSPPIRWDRRFALSTAARVALLVGGLTWGLSIFAVWTTVSPVGASGVQWFAWVFQRGVPAALAVAAALYPVGIYRTIVHGVRSMPGLVGRAVVGVGAISLLVWFPPALATDGLSGLGNELLGALGAGASWGAVQPPVGGAALAFRWGFQFLLLAAFSTAVAIVPARAIQVVFRPSGVGVSARSVGAPTPLEQDGDAEGRHAIMVPAPGPLSAATSPTDQ